MCVFVCLRGRVFVFHLEVFWFWGASAVFFLFLASCSICSFSSIKRHNWKALLPTLIAYFLCCVVILNRVNFRLCLGRFAQGCEVSYFIV